MEKIGQVILDDTLYPGKDLYTDGAIEDETLEIARNTGKNNGTELLQSGRAGRFSIIFLISGKIY